MLSTLRRVWPYVKLLLGVVIVVFIGRAFARDLGRLEARALHPGWLALAGLLYLAGLALSGVYWKRLLNRMGQHPPWGAALRAYFVGHLGKWVPGKAWAVMLRSSLVAEAGTRPGVAAVATFHEVLTTMAGGALVAVALFALFAPDTGTALTPERLWDLVRLQHPADLALDRASSVLLAVVILGPVLIPILPPVFNRLVHRVTMPFRDKAAAFPPVTWNNLAEGLAWTATGWGLLGLSLAAVLAGLGGPNLAADGPALARVTAAMSLSYVAGFVFVLTPNGLGLREAILVLFLAPELAARGGLGPADAQATAVQAAVVLRLVWTAFETALAAGLYVTGRRVPRAAEVAP